MKRILIFTLCIVVFLAFIIPGKTYAHKVSLSSEDTMKPYSERLEALNAELGTSYIFSPAQGYTMGDLEEFITSMSLDEFEQYVRDAHEGALLNEVRDDAISTGEPCLEVITSVHRLNRDTPWLATQRWVTDPVYGGMDSQNYSMKRARDGARRPGDVGFAPTGAKRRHRTFDSKRSLEF